MTATTNDIVSDDEAFGDPPPPPSKPELKDYRYEGTITALSSIAHGGETKSTTQILRTEKIVSANQVLEIPIISGNAMRGILRDCGMRFMLRCLGDPPLTTAAVHFLFSGGALSTKGGPRKTAGGARKVGTTGSPGTVTIGDARTLMDAIPLVGVFGGACGSMIMESKLKIGKMVPICDETRRVVPERYQASSMPSIWEYLQTESYTRRDDAKRESIRALIGAEERKLLDSAHERARKAAVAQEPDADVGEHQQMRYHVQTIAAGTRFYWWLRLHGATSLEWEALASCLVEFSKNPSIGGKSGIGHGQIEIKIDGWAEIGPSIRVEDKAVGAPLGATYKAHLETRKGDILALLGAI